MFGFGDDDEELSDDVRVGEIIVAIGYNVFKAFKRILCSHEHYDKFVFKGFRKDGGFSSRESANDGVDVVVVAGKVKVL